MSRLTELQGFKFLLPGRVWVVPERRVEPEHLVCGPGTVIVCPNPKCHAKIGVFNSRLYSSVNCHHGQIDFEPDQVRGAGQAAVCGQCGTTYMDFLDWDHLRQGHRARGKTIRVHTQLGWI